MIHPLQTKEVGTTECIRTASNSLGASLPVPMLALFELVASPTMLSPYTISLHHIPLQLFSPEEINYYIPFCGLTCQNVCRAFYVNQYCGFAR